MFFNANIFEENMAMKAKRGKKKKKKEEKCVQLAMYRRKWRQKAAEITRSSSQSMPYTFKAGFTKPRKDQALYFEPPTIPHTPYSAHTQSLYLQSRSKFPKLNTKSQIC
jgi:hypothetical protein